MKYKTFESFNMYGSKPISESDFLELVNKECKNWQSSKTELFRGQPADKSLDFTHLLLLIL